MSLFCPPERNLQRLRRGRRVNTDCHDSSDDEDAHEMDGFIVSDDDDEDAHEMDGFIVSDDDEDDSGDGNDDEGSSPNDDDGNNEGLWEFSDESADEGGDEEEEDVNEVAALGREARMNSGVHILVGAECVCGVTHGLQVNISDPTSPMDCRSLDTLPLNQIINEGTVVYDGSKGSHSCLDKVDLPEHTRGYMRVVLANIKRDHDANGRKVVVRAYDGKCYIHLHRSYTSGGAGNYLACLLPRAETLFHPERRWTEQGVVEKGALSRRVVPRFLSLAAGQLPACYDTTEVDTSIGVNSLGDKHPLLDANLHMACLCGQPLMTRHDDSHTPPNRHRRKRTRRVNRHRRVNRYRVFSLEYMPLSE